MWGPIETESLKTKTPACFAPMRFENSIRIETIHIVEFPLQRIAEDVVCLSDPLEAIFCRLVAWIDIRMKPPCKLPKSPLDVVHGRGPLDFKDDIEIITS